MKLSRLGDFIELVDLRNNDLTFKSDSLMGISVNKTLIKTKANTDNLNLRSYKIFKRDWFAYCLVTSRNGNKISLAFNDSDDCIISAINPIFKVKDETKLLPRYLMMYFNRPEFDRYARFNSWGSARETFSWDDMCNIKLKIPPIDIQKKYVAIYESMIANIQSYEKGTDDLKLVCDGYAEELRRKNGVKPLKNLIFEYNEKNINKKISLERGISTGKVLIIPKAVASDIANQKILYKGTFGFATNTARNGDKLSIAINNEKDCIISTSYCTFKTCNELVPEYLNIWMRRSEFDRYVRYNSWGSVREMFYFQDMEQVKICVPRIEIQNSIVKVFDLYNKILGFINNLSKIINRMCPVLIRGSVLEAQKGN